MIHVPETIARAALATGVAIAGGALGAFAAKNGERERLIPLVAIAGGALLGVAVLGVLPEAAQRMGSWWGSLTAAATGYLLFFLIGKYVYPICPACASTHDHEEEASSAQGVSNVSLLLALTLTLHAFIDGMAVAEGGLSHLTAALLLAVTLHKLPEGLALAALLRAAGRTALNAFLLTALIEGATLLGGLVGSTVFSSVSPLWCGALLAHLAGGFLYLVVHGFWGGLFLPDTLTRRLAPLAPRIGYASVGFISIALLLYLISR